MSALVVIAYQSAGFAGILGFLAFLDEFIFILVLMLEELRHFCGIINWYVVDIILFYKLQFYK